VPERWNYFISPAPLFLLGSGISFHFTPASVRGMIVDDVFMKLKFDTSLAANYQSTSQKIRVLTERWVSDSIFCPNCGCVGIDKYSNNQPVADFCCSNCHEDYELKSKKDAFGLRVVDGSYRTMLDRLTSSGNPNFFLLNYTARFEVVNFSVIPKHFFVPGIIEKRKPLASTAQRAGWVGCNIFLGNVPQSGRIFFIRDGKIESRGKVLADWKKTLFLREEKEVSTKGWLLDIMRSLEKLNKREFKLDDVYVFENELKRLHPENRHIKDKIRQQLQVLRDNGYLDFVARGRYELT
jgi:type II restriction enzyme